MYDTVKNVETSESKLKTELDLKMSTTNDEEIDWQVSEISEILWFTQIMLLNYIRMI